MFMCLQLLCNPIRTHHMSTKEARDFKSQNTSKNQSWETATKTNENLKHDYMAVVASNNNVSSISTGQKEHNPDMQQQLDKIEFS